MTLEQAIVQRLQLLSPDKQGEVLDFTEFLLTKQQEKPITNSGDASRLAAIQSLKGKYASCLTLSEHFALQKQQEIELESIDL